MFHTKVTALRLPDCLSTPKYHLMSSAKSPFKHNEVEINTIMKYRDIFHQKKKKPRVVRNNTYNCYFAISFFIPSQKNLSQKKPLRPPNPKVDMAPDMV